jgi:hypothetical protein
MFKYFLWRICPLWSSVGPNLKYLRFKNYFQCYTGIAGRQSDLPIKRAVVSCFSSWKKDFDTNLSNEELADLLAITGWQLIQSLLKILHKDKL